MNILYINHYAGSLKYGMEFRPYYLAKRWIANGHKVTMMAASYSHIRAKQPEVTTPFVSEIIDGITYQWCKTPSYEQNGAKRFVNMLVFIFRLFQYAFKINSVDAPTAVIASSTYPLDIFPAWFIAKKFKAKLIFEVHDLWPLSPIELGGMSKYHPFIMLIQFAEDFAYKHSDSVVSMLPKTLEYMVSRGLKKEKFNYIPNGIELKEWETSGLHANSENGKLIEEKIQSCKAEGFFTVAYLGTHGLANCLENLINAAEILRDEKIFFFFVGPGPEKESLKALAQKKKLLNIIFVDSIPKGEIPIITKLFDVNYIGLKKESLFRFGISPNKLMDYMAAKKPIINAVEAGNDPVKEAGCGISVPAENPQALAFAIQEIKAKPETELLLMGENGYKFVSNENDYEKLAQKFLKVMEK
ncbi:MAG: glycosyltransferase family 4 protein [Bacteriovorax sp.]|nr:glycosyltransferase family 4 protein [Bacteriovorax sp.]